MAFLNGTCIAFPLVEMARPGAEPETLPAAILLRGPSGSGKSDLGLRLIDDGARLVADDQVELSGPSSLTVSAPAAIAGLMEVRGIGPVALPSEPRARLVAVIDLVADDLVERLPEPAGTNIEGAEVPLWRLDPFGASAVAKIGVIVALATGRTRIEIGIGAS